MLFTQLVNVMFCFYRYPQRDAYQPYMNKNEQQTPHHIQQNPVHTSHTQQRRYEDVAPPGTDQPPIPGEEPSPRYDDNNRYGYERLEQSKERYNTQEQDNNREQDRNYNERQHEDTRDRKYERKSRSPSRNARNPSPKPNVIRKERHESPDRHKRKKHEETSDKKDSERDKYAKKEMSDDEKTKKSRDKKKKKEKKETDKKKKKERKSREEKHKRKSEEKDKKEKHKTKEENVEVTNDCAEKERSKEIEIPIEETHILPKVDQLSEPRSRIDSLRDDNSREADHERFRNKDRPEEPPQSLYDDINPENVDNDIVKTYGKLSASEEINKSEDNFERNANEKFETDVSKEYEDVLDIHTNESELIKTDSDLKPEFLAPLPEKSKWEMEDEPLNMPMESKYDAKTDKTGKVTNEVLKRAENAIFAKAINAIRPIEIKKISVDRAKLYSGEREKKEEEVKSLQVTIKGQEEVLPSTMIEPPKVEAVEQQPSKRIPVKERLGCKVDDIDRIVKVDRRSRSKSPPGRRNYERRVEIDDRRDKRDRERYDRDNRYHRGGYRGDNRRDIRRDIKDRRDFRRDDRRDYRRDDRYKRDPLSSYVRPDDDKFDKRKRSTSNSEERKHKRRDKKVRKEKVKKRDDENTEKDAPTGKDENKPKTTTEKRKTTLDEANFEPDYDLDSESEKDEKENSKRISPHAIEAKKPKLEEQVKDSSSSDSSSSSSEDEKKKKKHKKHKKKKSRKDSSSSSSDSDSDSSEEEQRKRKKHKKKSKKRKKSKHK